MKRYVYLGFFFILTGSLAATDQQPANQEGWPCDRKIDPVYIQLAEETGGQVQLFQPSETARSLALLESQLSGNEETVFRASGTLAGEKEFQVAIDSTIESVTFSAFVQCMKSVSFHAPSGEILPAAPNTKQNDFTSGRILTAKPPEKGLWNVVVSGTGYFSVIAEAKTKLNFTAEFVEVGGRPGHEGYFPLKRSPRLNQEETLSVRLSDKTKTAKIELFDREGNLIGQIPLQEVSGAEDETEYAGQVKLQIEQFRIVAEGTDENDLPFQRYSSKLFHAQ